MKMVSTAKYSNEIWNLFRREGRLGGALFVVREWPVASSMKAVQWNGLNSASRMLALWNPSSRNIAERDGDLARNGMWKVGIYKHVSVAWDLESIVLWLIR